MKNPNRDVNWYVEQNVGRAVFCSIRNAVSDSVYWVLDGFMVLDVDRVVEEALHTDPKNPGLQEFLHPCGAETETT